MQTYILLTREPLARALATLEEPWRALAAFPASADGEVGACVDFHGIVRDREPQGAEEPQRAGGPEPAAAPERSRPEATDEAILALEYEAHEEMARHQMEKILQRLAQRHPLRAALVIHRLGRIEVGEPSLFIRLLAPHRAEALQACAEFIDELKRWVPIWKHAVRSGE